MSNPLSLFIRTLYIHRDLIAKGSHLVNSLLQIVPLDYAQRFKLFPALLHSPEITKGAKTWMFCSFKVLCPGSPSFMFLA